MDDLRLSDVGKARLFRGAISREQAGLLPICDSEHDWRTSAPLRGAELLAFWAQVWERNQNTLANTSDDRLLAAWRITRQLAVIRGAIMHGEPLSTVCGDGPDTLASDFTSFVDIADWGLRGLLTEGSPLAPPDVPSEHLTPSGLVSEDYDPGRDERLLRFQQVVEYFGLASLRLDASDRARRGFAWFLSPDTIRAGWPSPPSIFLFEIRLVEKAVALLSDHGDAEARAEITARWDLEPHEVAQVVTLARLALAMRYDADDLKGGKALTLSRLERQITKAGDALDHRGAAMMLREWWRIFRDKGEAQVEDEFGDMDGVIKVSATRKRLAKPKDETQ